MPHYRSIFVSDIHLGTLGSRADDLNKFLKHNSCDILYLVGDVLDFWALSRRSYFPSSHTKLLRRFLKQKQVIYVLGNHDEILRKFLPLVLGNITMCNEILHETKNGRKYLIIHGDGFDQIMQCAPWLAWIGDIGYTFLLRANFWINRVRKLFHLPYWSLSAYVKSSVKGAVKFVGKYETIVSQSVKSKNIDGIICGHIHSAAFREMNGIMYINCGDWVESMTAIVEHDDGNLELIYWKDFEK